MFKQILLTSTLLAGIPAVAMERVKETSIEEDALRIEEKVKLLLQDENDNVTHEVEVSLRHAQLIGALPTLLENSECDFKKAEFPLPLVTIHQWGLIETQLERVYGIVHGYDNAPQLRQEIVAVYGGLDSKTLINLICALDFMHVSTLLEIAVESLLTHGLKDISYEEVASLPGDIGNRFIVRNILSNIGALPAKELMVLKGHARAVLSVCTALDGKYIVSGSADGTIRVWDMQGMAVAVCKGHEASVESVCVTPDGKHIVSGSLDNTVRVWDMQGRAVAVYRGYEGSVVSVCVTPDGKHIVSGSFDNSVRVCDMQGNEVAICRGHEKFIRSVCVAPDSKHIVSGSDDNTVRVWDMQGREVVVCRGHEKIVGSVCATPDSKHIVSGSYDKTVRVWDLQGYEVAVCRGHEGPVHSVCVTPDGKHIVSGCRHNTVRLWDMVGSKVAVCRGHKEPVFSVCVTPDGKHIVSGSADKSVRVWDIGLLDRILGMDKDQAKEVWDYVIKPLKENDQQKCWEEIEAILAENLEKVMDHNSNEKSE